MIYEETQTLEVRILDDGLTQARRKDRKPMTDGDRAEAKAILDRFRIPEIPGPMLERDKEYSQE